MYECKNQFLVRLVYKRWNKSLVYMKERMTQCVNSFDKYVAHNTLGWFGKWLKKSFIEVVGFSYVKVLFFLNRFILLSD